MGDFKEIKTQEEFDNAIKERLDRERAKFKDYDELKTTIQNLNNELATARTTLQQNADAKKDLDNQIAELNKKIKGYETDSAKTRIALECGLPYELAGRLTGESEEDIKKDAEKLAGMMKPPTPAPTKAPESGPGDLINEAYKSLLSNVSK